MSTNEQNAVVIRPLIPTDFDTTMRIAEVMVKSGMAPDHIKTREGAFMAIQMGAGLGLTPMQSVQGIMMIGKKVALYGDTMLAVVKASGLLESIKEEVTGEGDKMAAKCTVKRKGEESVVIGTWDVKDATAAGKWNQGIWKQYPKRMLQMRARSFALRDAFPDLLLGLQHSVEELTGGEIIDVTPNYNYDDNIHDYKPSVSSKGPDLNNKFVSLHGVEPIENITLLKEELFGYLKDKLEAIETAEEFEAHTAWSRSNYAATKSVIDKDSAEGKELGDLFFAKKRRFEKTNYTENSNLDL